jgi:hypothetical protein
MDIKLTSSSGLVAFIRTLALGGCERFQCVVWLPPLPSFLWRHNPGMRPFHLVSAFFRDSADVSPMIVPISVNKALTSCLQNIEVCQRGSYFENHQIIEVFVRPPMGYNLECCR